MDLHSPAAAPIALWHRVFLAQTHALIDPRHVAPSEFADLPTHVLQPERLAGRVRHPPLLVTLEALARDRRLQLLDQADAHLREYGRPRFDDPLDRVITLSPKGTLRNCWMLVCLMMGTTLFPLRYTLMFPIYGALTLSRWITFKTCRAPVFPPELEAECAIAPDDPYALPEPRFMADFASDPAIYARALQRHRERMLWR
ncbi:MAG TPA: hypothetical protein DEB32_03045 [Stenotrophomonas sp.]|uniref:hypothetical protein n=1 Tax=Stenotrophomonas sp. TaxID=69392 RepID=UPI000E8DF34F|nr:hypothetical protein [Stenotrophomonas sp.]HBS61708.1 hypothetical protein [Stenotrophomonas sp.]